MLLTIFNLFFLLQIDDRAKVVTVQAERLRIVLITALCLSFPSAGPALKLGQYSHKKSVPVYRGEKFISIPAL